MEDALFQKQIQELANSRYSLAIATLLARASRLEIENKSLRDDNWILTVENDALGKEALELREMLNKYQG